MTQYLTFREKFKIESFHKLGEDVELGEVVFDAEKCSGCGYCAAACAAKAIELVDKKARMVKDLPFCMSCGDCVAICPEGAVKLNRFIDFKKAFRYLDRGEPLWPRKF